MIYLVIMCSVWGAEYVDAIYRDWQDANEYREGREAYYAAISDSPPRFRIDERQLR